MSVAAAFIWFVVIFLPVEHLKAIWAQVLDLLMYA
jgi:hypothetical protein